MRFSSLPTWGGHCLVAVIALVFGIGLVLLRVGQTPVFASGHPSAAQSLSADAEAWLRVTVNDGKFPELRWPDFSDYSKHVDKLYDLNGYSLWWTKGQEPTSESSLNPR